MKRKDRNESMQVEAGSHNPTSDAEIEALLMSGTEYEMWSPIFAPRAAVELIMLLEGHQQKPDRE